MRRFAGVFVGAIQRAQKCHDQECRESSFAPTHFPIPIHVLQACGISTEPVCEHLSIFDLAPHCRTFQTTLRPWTTICLSPTTRRQIFCSMTQALTSLDCWTQRKLLLKRP